MSTVSLPVNFGTDSDNQHYHSIDSYNVSIASIQSELNEQIVRGT
jgi:hypothetical protein